MRFKFKSSKLEQFYTSERRAKRYPPEVVDAFFDVISVIAAAVDERDIYALKGFRFEKLNGQRGIRGERSLRLNVQWRLIVKLEHDEQGKLMLIIDIEKHYND